jgi:hypothetical protein
MTRSNFADWLSRRLTHAELAAEVERLFREKGPRLPAQMRTDLPYFIEDRSDRALAECLAMNGNSAEDSEFVRWCRDLADELRDPYACRGVGRDDFCGEKGPGRNDGSVQKAGKVE